MSAATAKARELEEFRRDLRRLSLDAPFPDYGPLFTPGHATPVEPVLWKWRDLQPRILRAGDLLTLEAGGDRRTLRLCNPGLPPRSGTTRTLWASIQMIKPGEVAVAHRHTATALRFILHGEGAYTTVEGEQYGMRRGDLVLTPSWTWHDHMHTGTEPMIWLDVLDIPLTRALDSEFFEPYCRPQQPVSRPAGRSPGKYAAPAMRPTWNPEPVPETPLLAYPWERTIAALDALGDSEASPFDDVSVDYVNPRTGGPTLRTILCRCQRLRPRRRLRPHRHNSSAVYHVVQGRGATVIEGRRFEWEAGDFLVVPPWSRHQFENDGGEEALLFSVHDTPVLEALGLYREEEGGGIP